MRNILGSISTIKNFMGNAGRNTCNEYLYNALLDAIESMEMDVAMKPIEDSCEEKTHYKCKCGYIFLTKYSDGYRLGNKPNYCERCGQAIDWSEININLYPRGKSL